MVLSTELWLKWLLKPVMKETKYPFIPGANIDIDLCIETKLNKYEPKLDLILFHVSGMYAFLQTRPLVQRYS